MLVYHTSRAESRGTMKEFDLSKATTYTERTEAREQARQRILSDIPCTEYLERAPRGGYICPYCGSGTGPNGTGAVKYYKTTNTCGCFACPEPGQRARKFDVLDCIQQVFNCDYNEALQIGADRLGISLARADGRRTKETGASGKTSATAVKTPHNDEQRPIIDYSAYYEKCRRNLDNPAAISYLKARGISPETAADLQTGFDLQADPANAPGAMDDERRPHPAPRLIFPCTKDFYIARSIDPATPPAFKAPNPKGSSTKLYNAAALYSGAEVVFITEGVFDCLSFIETGAAAVALNGKGNGALLVQQLKEKPTESIIVICHDNEKNADGTPDTAKQADTMERAQKLNNDLHHIGVKSIIYNVAGDYHDANDALTKAPETFDEMIYKAAQEAADMANRDYLSEFLDKVQTEAYKPYKTGLSFFDNLLGGGVIQQSLLLLMAAPGTGKTTLCQQIAEAMAADEKPVVYLNFEMSREQMIAKAISGRLAKDGKGRTTTEILQGYNWSDDDRQIITAAVAEYRKTVAPFIQYNPDEIGTNIEDINEYLTAIGTAAQNAGTTAPVVVVDYLHLITSKAGDDAQELVKKSIVSLKNYAKDFNTFVIGIVATNRASNKAGAITMESGRDSSAIEYTGDYQLSLNYYAIDKGDIKPSETDKIAELQQKPWRQMIIRVLKNRFGVPGRSAKVYFNAAHNTFYGEYDWLPADSERTPFDDVSTTVNGEPNKI